MHSMTFKNQYLITGAVRHKGSFTSPDTKQTLNYDTNKLFVQMLLKNGKGYSTVEYRFGVSDDFDKLCNEQLITLNGSKSNVFV